MNVYKSRELPFDGGVQPQPWEDGLYYNTSVPINTGCTMLPYNASIDNARTWHLYKMANATSKYSFPVFDGMETFESTNRGPEHFNDCKHTKVCGVNYPFFTHSYAFFGDNCLRTSSTPHWQQSTSAVRAPVEGLAIEDRAWISDLSFNNSTGQNSYANAQRNAWHAMQPRFEGRLSLINSLFELKDFRSIMKQLARLKPWRVLQSIREGVPQSRRFDPSRPVAGLYLTNELAIKPLLRDIEAVIAQIYDIVYDAEVQFDLLGQMTQKSRWGMDLDSSNTGTWYPESWNWNVMRGRVDYLHFNATMEYQYDYKTRSLLDSFKKYWGLSITSEALWNAIPFGFIADYFSGISKSIHNMEHDRNVDLSMSQYCESILRHKGVGFYFSKPGASLIPDQDTVAYINGNLDKGQILQTLPRVLIAGYSGSKYMRVRTAPNQGAALPLFKIPSGKQGLTMAALLRTFF